MRRRTGLALFPGELRLPKMIDPRWPPVHCDFPKLVDKRSRWGMYRMARDGERRTKNRPVGVLTGRQFGDGRVIEVAERYLKHDGNLDRVRFHFCQFATPDHEWSDSEAGLGSIIIECAEDGIFLVTKAKFFTEFPQGRLGKRFPGVQPASGQGILAGMASQLRRAPCEQQAGIATFKRWCHNECDACLPKVRVGNFPALEVAEVARHTGPQCVIKRIRGLHASICNSA